MHVFCHSANVLIRQIILIMTFTSGKLRGEGKVEVTVWDLRRGSTLQVAGGSGKNVAQGGCPRAPAAAPLGACLFLCAVGMGAFPHHWWRLNRGDPC